ncbi:MAG: DUF5615 family PIN-like protein [Acidimicrobiales bacterium]
MRFLVDASLSPRVADLLRSAGHDAVHVRDEGLASAPDPLIFDRAAEQGSVVVTADPDFGMILAHRGSATPSVILFRGRTTRRADDQVDAVLANLDQLRGPLEEGAVAVLGDGHLRVRSLPITGGIEPRDPRGPHPEV